MANTTEAGQRDIPGVIARPPLIYLGVLALAIALDWALTGPGLGLPYELRIAAGTILLIAGLCLIVAAATLFNAAKTNIQTGKPTTAIVTTGIYRYTRNPIYLGMALIYTALSLFADSFIGLAGLPVALVIVHYGVIAREERYLEVKFGQPYRDYKARVGRWGGPI
jgi:protein-S-isoprenylcysteine O-methyltransferase Ste14